MNPRLSPFELEYSPSPILESVMSFSKLATELVYHIAGYVVAEYIDTAITTPPRPAWVAHYNKDLTKFALSVISERRLGVQQPAELSGSDWMEWSGVTEQDFIDVVLNCAHVSTMKQTPTQPPGPSDPPSSTSTRSSGYAPASPQTVESDTSYTMVDDSTYTITDILGLESDEEYSSDGFEDNESDVDLYSDSSDDVDADMDDLSDDSDYDSEIDADERKEMFKDWSFNEAREELPLNPIGPLLAVDSTVREVTLKVVHHALGLRPCQGKNFLREIETLLRTLRKCYRICLTPPFAYTDEFVPEYKGPDTPLIDAYISLSIASYTQRITRDFFNDLADAIPAAVVDEFMEMMKYTKYLAFGITPAF